MYCDNGNLIVGITTSTPYHQAIEAPVTHDGSFMNNFTRLPSAIKGSKAKVLSTTSRIDDKEPVGVSYS